MTPAKRKPGRPKAEPTTPVMLRLTDVQRKAYLERGGARWVKRLIDDAKNEFQQDIAQTEEK